MPAISTGLSNADWLWVANGLFLQSFAVWRPPLSLAGSQKYSGCQSNAAQSDRMGPLLRVVRPHAGGSSACEREFYGVGAECNSACVYAFCGCSRTLLTLPCSTMVPDWNTTT
jgi:hypothetical protein